jgi:hypothetical protein
MEMPEALFLADELEAPLGTVIGAELYRRAAKELRRLHAENAAIAAALASSCDEQRHELWESGGVAGCERARVAERQRDALLEALKDMLNAENDYPYGGMSESEISAIRKARAAIKAVEETK